jgi:kynureninase
MHDSKSDALQRDASDPLAHFADEFHHPKRADGEPLIYLCGHSLGLAPKSAAAYIQQELDSWAAAGVLGHHDGVRPWIPYHRLVREPLSALVGANSGEVVAMNSLTVNLHLMMTSFFRPRGTRNRILIEASAFGSDRYAVVSQLALHGLNEEEHLIEIAPRPTERHLRTADIIERIGFESERLALVLLPGVQYLSGQSLQLQPIIAATRRVGAVAGLDLAHAIGNTVLELHDWGADFAVWCSYKYLNAGPGATGGCFVHERHAQRFDLPRLAGWWGHDAGSRFQMSPDFHPMPGAEGWQLSNPPIFSTAPLLASLDIFKRAGIVNLRAKSVALTGFLESLIRAQLANAIHIITPADAPERGCQLSLRILRAPAHAKRILARLTAAGLIGDWREPDIIRLAPVPLYNSFMDCFRAVQILSGALQE